MAADPPIDRAALNEFIALCGPAWHPRLSALRAAAAAQTREGRNAQQFHCIELMIDRLASDGTDRPVNGTQARLARYATDALALHDALGPAGRARLHDRLADALAGVGSLVPLCHLLRTASLQRSRGFEVAFAGLADAAPFDLLIRRGEADAEIACDVISAEEGHFVHRGAWFRLVDRIDPELQTWLRAHPGRYLLKLTFPLGLRTADGDAQPSPRCTPASPRCCRSASGPTATRPWCSGSTR